MFSQFYVLSLRGDMIITRDYRRDIPKGTAEIFFRKVKFWTGDAPPVFNADGVSYAFIKKNGLYFVGTTALNPSPAYAVELLTKIAKVFKDFCGVLNEESIRKNFILVYELLEEMLDYGLPQTTNTEHLKSCVHNEAASVVQPKLGLNIPQWKAKTVPSNAVHRPVGPVAEQRNRNKKNEIFVDILERVVVLMSANGAVTNSAIDGSIQMKSYLQGNPELRLALNEDLVIKGQQMSGGYGAVQLDDCNFHECADLMEFAETKTISFYPPDGEFAVMNYRITGDFRVPFRIFPFVDKQSPHKLEVTIKIRADVPDQNYGGNVLVSCAMPKTTASVSTELCTQIPGQTAEYVEADQKLLWNFRKLQGGKEATIKARISLSTPLAATANFKKDLGPISMNFEIPMYNVSNLQVKSLRIAEGHRSNNLCRWVRYVTQTSSYVCRF